MFMLLSSFYPLFVWIITGIFHIHFLHLLLLNTCPRCSSRHPRTLPIFLTHPYSLIICIYTYSPIFMLFYYSPFKNIHFISPLLFLNAYKILSDIRCSLFIASPIIYILINYLCRPSI